MATDSLRLKFDYRTELVATAVSTPEASSAITEPGWYVGAQHSRSAKLDYRTVYEAVATALCMNSGGRFTPTKT